VCGLHAPQKKTALFTGPLMSAFALRDNWRAIGTFIITLYIATIQALNSAAAAQSMQGGQGTDRRAGRAPKLYSVMYTLLKEYNRVALLSSPFS
jgi:hypothetical protein